MDVLVGVVANIAGKNGRTSMGLLIILLWNMDVLLGIVGNIAVKYGCTSRGC